MSTGSGVGRFGRWRWRAGLALVVAIGAYLRLRGLTFQSYWDDELFSAAVSSPQLSPFQVVVLTMQDVHPPLFQLLLWAWFKVVGFSELTGRLFPALFGILALPVLYRIGDEMKARSAGLVAALLCAVNIFHLAYSQEMRSYSLLFFLGAAALLFYLRLLRNPGRANIAGFLICNIAMVYTHFFGVFAVAAEVAGIALLLRREPGLRRPAAIIAVVGGIAALPLIPLILRNAAVKSFWIAKPPLDFATDYFIQYFGSALLAGAAVLLMLLAVRGSTAEARDRTVVHILLLWLACVFVIPYVRSLMAQPLLTSRNTIVALPAVLLLVGLGWASIRDGVARGLLLAVLVVVSAMRIFHEPPYYRTAVKPQIREAARALMAAQPAPDAVFAAQEVVRNFNVYFELYDAPFRVRPLAQLQDLRAAGRAPARFWIIDGRVGPLFAQSVMADRTLHTVARQDFRGAAFVEMEPAP